MNMDRGHNDNDEPTHEQQVEADLDTLHEAERAIEEARLRGDGGTELPDDFEELINDELAAEQIYCILDENMTDEGAALTRENIAYEYLCSVGFVEGIKALADRRLEEMRTRTEDIRAENEALAEEIKLRKEEIKLRKAAMPTEAQVEGYPPDVNDPDGRGCTGCEICAAERDEPEEFSPEWEALLDLP